MLCSNVLRSLRGLLTTSGRPGRPGTARKSGRRARLELETLEDRRLMSASAITDMTQWAQQFPAPNFGQRLWINFDGGKDDKGYTISPFVAQPGQDRDAAIQ